jgi:DegV family protein with EDD domain
VYREALRTHDAIVSLHIAWTLSSTWNVAASAARAIDPDRIHVVDSMSTSVGLGWLVQIATNMAEQGREAEEIVAEVTEVMPRLRLYMTLETLEYLQRGGRIGRAQAFLGSLLNVKPVLQLQDGVVQPIERVRTRGASTRKLIELAEKAGPTERLVVVHGDCLQEGERIRQELGRLRPIESISLVEVGAVIATYAGPGILGVGCLLAS